MKPEPALEVDMDEQALEQAAQPTVPDPTRKVTESVFEDDGTVPDKQISRWKGEGGSWTPAD